jgi:hypothetical protein
MNARQAFLVQQECTRLIEQLSLPDAKVRAVTMVVKRLLLDAPYYHNGVHINPKVKALGAGVYEVTNDNANH